MKPCKKCPLSALCIGAGGTLEDLIARLVLDHIDHFEKSGRMPETQYEAQAVRSIATTQATKRVKKMLETKLPTDCPLLRSHHANSEGKPLIYIDVPAELEDGIDE